MLEYDISPDEKEVLFSTQPAGEPSQIWLAPVDRSAPPVMISASGDRFPRFGPDGQVLLRVTEGKDYYLAKMHKDGSGRAKVFQMPILDFDGISPDSRYVVVGLPLLDAKGRGTGASKAVISLTGGAPQRFCEAACATAPTWSPDGKYFYVAIEPPSQSSPKGTTLAIAVPPGETLPPLSALKIRPPGTKLLHQFNVFPGSNFSYSYLKPSMHANLFRIPLNQ
jgi:Tol biopolymer transport system component